MLVERHDSRRHQRLTVERLDASGAVSWSVPVRSDPIHRPQSVLHATTGRPLVATNDATQVFFAHGHTVVAIAADGTESWSRNFRQWSARPPAALSASESTVAACGAAHLVTLDARDGAIRHQEELEEHDTLLSCAMDAADTLWTLRRVEPEYNSPEAVILERRNANGELMPGSVLEWAPEAPVVIEPVAGEPGVVLASGSRVQRLDGDGETLWERELSVPEPGCDANATIAAVAASAERAVVAFVPMRCSSTALRRDRTVVVTLAGSSGVPRGRQRIQASGPDGHAIATAVAARSGRVAAAGRFSPHMRLAGHSARGDYDVECFRDDGRHESSGEVADPVGDRCPAGFSRNIYPEVGAFLWWTDR